MRLYAFALVASTPILARNTNFTRTSVSTMADLNLPAGPFRPDGIHNDIHVDQSLAVRGYENGEERTRSVQPVSIEAKMKFAASNLLSELYKYHPSVNKLTDHVMGQLRESDGNVIDHFTGLYFNVNANEKAELERVIAFLKVRQKLVRMKHRTKGLVESIRMAIRARQKERVEESEGELAQWLKEKLDPDKVFKKLSIAEKTLGRTMINPFASPDLEVLRRYIEMYNTLPIDAQGKEFTLVGTLYSGFGIELAHYLLVESHSPLFGSEASAMYQDLLMQWYRDDVDMGAAADQLKIATKTAKGNWLKHLDTFIKYSALLHEKGRLKGGNTFTYLKTRLGDYLFSLLIADARNQVTSNVSDWDDKLFNTWKTEGVTPEDLHTKVFGPPRLAEIKKNRDEWELIRGRFAAWWAENEFNQRTPFLHNFFQH